MSLKSESPVNVRLHLGAEKTGTSFLQYLCTLNRDLLLRQGVYFPFGTPHDERSMRNGRISAGNGRELARMVEACDWQRVQGWFEAAIDQSRKYCCREMLISSEQLLAPLAAPGAFAHFVRALQTYRVGKVSLLLVLRHPAGQLVSLYKHRAKGGRVGRIREWVKHGYLLPNHLAELRQCIESAGVELCVRAYTRRPGGLEHLFFRDWLGLECEVSGETAEVNPSLSLSELELVRLLHTRRPELVPFVHERLSMLPRVEKVQVKALEIHARAVADSSVWQYREEWQQWNAVLPEGEQLSIPARPPDIPEYPQDFGFSGRQIDELATLLVEAASFRFLLKLIWRSRIRPALGRIARAVGVRR